jgi:glycerophosphoryl diester phosphodiesterase
MPAWPRLIGHRGAARRAPENTLAGFRKAAELGVRWVEFDVRLSADGRCVLLHDDTLERTTDGCGPAAPLGFAELRHLDAGGWFAPEFRGERVPSLEETIDLLAELGLGAVVELKPGAGTEAATARAALALLAARWPADGRPLLVSSFDRTALAAAREAAPQILRALTVGAVPGDFREQAAALGCAMLHADQGRLDQAAVAAVHGAGLPVFAYTVNDPAQARRLFAWGVDAVFTDAPDLLTPDLPNSEPLDRNPPRPAVADDPI